MLVKQRGKLFRLRVPKSLKLVYVHGKGLGLFANKNFKKGFKYLTHEQQEKLKPSLTSFLLSKYESNRRNQSAD